MQLAGRPVETDDARAAWLTTTLAPAVPRRVASLVPQGFAAHARVLHPAVRYDGDEDVEVPWAAVARHNRRIAHRLMQWPAITGSWDFVADLDQPELWNDAPAEGHLPVAVAGRLAAVLARHTTAPADCWFGLAADAAPQLVGASGYLLVRGPADLAAANFVPEPAEQGPSVWWPADRAWVVVTDPHLTSTFVGGSAAAVADVLTADGIDAWPADPADPVTPGSDRINPPPGDEPAGPGG